MMGGKVVHNAKRFGVAKFGVHLGEAKRQVHHWIACMSAGLHSGELGVVRVVQHQPLVMRSLLYIIRRVVELVG